jgi:acyl-CoA thioester hydrolase
MADKYVETLRLMPQDWDCDHLGHVNVRSYMGWIGDAAFSLWAMHGLGRDESLAENVGVAAVRAEVDYQAELRGGDVVRMETTVESIGERKIIFRHRLIRVADDKQVMGARLTGVCLDLGQRKSRPFPQGFAGRIAETFGIEPTSPKGAAA